VRIKSQQDFFSGLMFVVIGIAFAWGATYYTVGGAARMGPGYFPLVLGVLLAALGAFVLFESLVVETEDGEPIGGWAWRPLVFVILANLAFGVCIGGLPSMGVPALGLVVGIYLLTIISTLANGAIRWKETVILATVLAVGSYFAFIVLLKLQLQVWPAFVGS
jgi:hypothetical protein